MGKPTPLNIAIVGMAPESAHLAPLNDPEWGCWGLAIDPQAPYFQRRFELHGIEQIKSEVLLGRVQELNTPVYMQAHFVDVRASRAYPLFDIIEDIYPHGYPRPDQTDWFQSQIGYMLAMAIYERAAHIGIWGVSAQEQYEEQRPNLDHLIGIAIGRGIRVTVPVVSGLCKYHALDPQWPERYGYTAQWK